MTMPNVLFDPTMNGLADALTLHQRRHEVLASNLANVETPGFRARELDFATALKEAFASANDTAPEHALPPGEGVRMVEDAGAPPRADGNTVDVDLQMTKLGANGGRYVALARILGQRITLLRQAIDGSR
jgi:flagellar basal-body rod protein FlgB